MATTSRRILKPLTEKQEQERATATWNNLGLPTDKPCQIYPRVSSPEQKKNVSAEMQQDKSFALLCGWTDDLIIMDTDDLGLSGQLRMEDRPAFVKMLRRIADGTEKAVIAAQVDRLFRDRWGAEYAKFMEICFTYGVKVVTPNPWRTSIDFIYDFSIAWHVDKFRRKCEEAWSYIENHVNRMIAARDALSWAGFWACGNLPIGYIVDRREKIDGMKNSHYRKYIVYELHAKIIRWLFDRYRSLTGQVNELFREISRREYLFPAFEGSVDEELVSRCSLKQVLDEKGRIKGYKIASTLGLRSILSNPAYAGYWVYKGVVVKGDNHEAIVDTGTFLYAFNRLSPSNLDGSPNESYTERKGQYTKKHNAEKPALLKNTIKSGDERFTVYTPTYPLQGKATAGTAVAAYALYPKTSGVRGAAYMFLASEVDSKFLERFIYCLQHTQGFDDYLDHESQEMEARAQLQADIERDIKAVQSLIAKLKVRLTILTDGEEDGETEQETKLKAAEKDEDEAELVRVVRKAFREQKVELARLLAKQRELASSSDLAATRRTYKQLMQEAGEAWEEVVLLEEIPLMIDTFVKEVVLTVLSPRFYKLSIHWYDPAWGIDERVCFKGGNPSLHWKPEEDTILREHYPEASRAELMRLLPTRSFAAITNRASILKIGRPNRERENTPRSIFCWQDLQVMEQCGLAEEQLRSDEGANLLRWTASSPY